MTLEVAATSSFDGEALLRGFEWLGTAVQEQNKHFETLNDRLGSVRAKTDQAAKANKSFLDTAVGINQMLELGKKAWNAAEKAISTTVDALKAAATWSNVLDSRFAATSDRVDDLQRAFGATAEKSGALNGIFDAVQTALEQFTKWVSSPEGGDAINGFFQVLAKGAAAAALVLGTVVHTVNAVQEAFERIQRVRQGGLMALSAFSGSKPNDENSIETQLFNLFEQLNNASGKPQGKTAPKPQANRAAAAQTTDFGFLNANMSWLYMHLNVNEERDNLRAIARLQADERRNQYEHNRAISELLLADQERRKEYALEVLGNQQGFIRQLVANQEGGVVAQAETAAKLQDVFDTIASSMTNLVVAATESMITGTASILGALGNLLASFVSMLGSMLMRASIGIGIFAALTGDVAAIGLAAGAFVAGAGLVALAGEIKGGGGGGGGSAYGGAGRGRGAPSGAYGSTRRYGGERSMPSVGMGGASGFVSAPAGGAMVNNYNLSFDGATILDPTSSGSAGLGRVLRRSLDRADELAGRRHR